MVRRRKLDDRKLASGDAELTALALVFIDFDFSFSHCVKLPSVHGNSSVEEPIKLVIGGG